MHITESVIVITLIILAIGILTYWKFEISRPFLGLGFISTVITGLTPIFIPITISNRQELQSYCLGGPVPFIQQKNWMTPPSDWFPHSVTLMDPWDIPTLIFWDKFFLSVVIVWLGLIIARPSCRLWRHHQKDEKVSRRPGGFPE